ncbi:hypothetical protein M378DRAFT_164146, partial [Amanita muscaria Koide BX008]
MPPRGCRRHHASITVSAVVQIYGAFAWQIRENLIFGLATYYTYESTIPAFAVLLHMVCFNGNNENISRRCETTHSTVCHAGPEEPANYGGCCKRNENMEL